MLRSLLVALLASIAAVLGAETEFRFVLLLPAAVLSVVAGALARTAVRGGVAYSIERSLFIPVLWLGVAVLSSDLRIVTIGGGGSAASLAGWFLGGPWAWATVFAWGVGMKRLFELDAARQRRSSAKPGGRWLVIGASAALSLGLVLMVAVFGGGAITTVLAAFAAFAGAVLLVRGFPRALATRHGRCGFWIAHVVGSAAPAPLLSTLTLFLVMIESDLTERESLPAALLLGWGIGLALFGARLTFSKPFEGYTRTKPGKALHA